MRILFIGDVVGKNGTQFLCQKLPPLRRTMEPDLVVVYGENAAEGNGILPGTADEIFSAGAGVITLGNHALRRREIFDYLDREEAIKRSGELSYTCKWEMSREIVGSIVMHYDKVDGIILLSAFPCGPDSMVNELIARRVKRVPMLNLVLDSQSGTAGI